MSSENNKPVRTFCDGQGCPECVGYGYMSGISDHDYWGEDEYYDDDDTIELTLTRSGRLALRFERAAAELNFWRKFWRIAVRRRVNNWRHALRYRFDREYRASIDEIPF